jgi:hypothetical protein
MWTTSRKLSIPWGRKAALIRDPDELMEFWQSGKTMADVFPDSLPWLFVAGGDGSW